MTTGSPVSFVSSLLQLAQRLTDGLLRGKAIQRGRFPVPVGNHRVQVLDDHGFAAVFECCASSRALGSDRSFSGPCTLGGLTTSIDPAS